MDLFDDILPGAPTARSRPGGKFVPKVKSKKLPRKEISASEHATPPTSKDSEGISQNECHNAVAAHPPLVELQNTEKATTSKLGNSIQVGVDRDTALLVDDLPFTTAMSEVVANQNFTDFPKSASGADSVGFEVDSVTKSIPEIDLNNGTSQPVHSANAVESELNNVASPSTTCSTIGGIKEPPTYGEGSFLDNNKGLEILDSPNVGFKSAPDENNTAISVSNLHSNFDLGKGGVLSAAFELHPFSNVLLDPGPSTRNDNRSMEAVIPSKPDSEAVAHNGTRDWPSSFGKSAAGTADIFLGLDSLDDFLTQDASGTGKPALNSFIVKGTEKIFAFSACNSVSSFGVCDTTQVERRPEYHTTQDSGTLNEDGVVNEDDCCTNNSRLETQEVTALNHDSPVDNVFHCQSLKSGTDPPFEVPMHEELANSADSPTLAYFLHQNVTKEKEDDNERRKFLRKHGRSSITGAEDEGGKTSRLLRKQAARKRTNNPLNEDDDVLDPPYNSNRDELEENGDEYEVDYSSKKKRASTSSKKKSVTKTEKTSKKRKKASDDLDKTTKEPPKRFSHSTRRRKRCVDKALLENDELDYRTLPIRDVILLADYKERLAKKEATTSKTSSTNQSDGDFFHEAGANNEEDIFGSEDGGDPDDDHASERVTSTALFNYQSFMDKAPRGKWSKQDTELFYEAVRQIGTDFSIIQQLFPGKTRHQLKLKYKKEDRQHPLWLSDAFNNRATDYSHFKSVIEKLQQASGKAEQGPSKDASEFMLGEEVEDLTPETNEEVGTAEQEKVSTAKQDDAYVKEDQEDFAAFHSPEQSDDSDDDLQRWSQYKSDF